MVKLLSMSNLTYDRLKRTAQLILPGLGALYFTLSQIWGLPYGEEVVGSIAALNTFIGGIVVVSSNQYQARHSAADGALILEEVDGVLKYTMELERDPSELSGQDEFRLKIEER